MTEITRKQYEQALRDKARLEVQLEQLELKALHDPDIQELVRLRAWMRHEAGRVTGTLFNPVVPEGWPPGLEGDMEVEKALLRLLPR